MFLDGRPDMSSQPSLPSLRFRLKRLWRFAKRNTIILPGLLSAIAVLVSFATIALDRSFVIGEFTVPDEERANGMTSISIGRMLYDRVSTIQSGAKAAVAEQHLGGEAFESLDTAPKGSDFKWLWFNVPLASVVEQLRNTFGMKQT